MMTYDCGHQGKRIPAEFLNSEIYHEWLNHKPTVCFECHINRLADEAFTKADAQHCASLEQSSTSQKGNVVESEVSNV